MFRRFFVGVALFSCVGLAAASQTIPNWATPPSWTPPRTSGVRPFGVESDIAGPLPFIPITPCRQYDSRNATPLPDNTSRTITLSGAPCGIPSVAAAVSLNITVFNISGALGNAVFRLGIVSPPPTAWINFPPTETQRGNAGVVSTFGPGQIVVQVNMGAGQVDFTVDVNGYFSDTPGNPNSFFQIVNSSDNLSLDTVNFSTTCFSACGIAAAIYSPNDAFAMGGRSNASSGANYGVVGTTLSASNGTAGVLGVLGSVAGRPAPAGNYAGAGVRGDSFSGYGALGVSRATGVGAALVDTGGAQLAYALLAAAGPTTYAVYAGGNFGGTGAKYFVEPHPTDATKVIRYISLEGPESGTYFRGTATTENGRAVIEVPESFRMVTESEGMTVQLTPIGELATLAVASRDLNRIVVRSSTDVTFDYLVNGVRKGYRDFRPIGAGTEFMPRSADEKLPAYLNEEQKRKVLANGTYNEDGTVNMQTAERLGWTRVWVERETKARQEAEDARKAAADKIR